MNSKLTGEGDDDAVKKHCHFHLTLTVEPRHENKSCSACRERVNERMREWKNECDSVRV